MSLHLFLRVTDESRLKQIHEGKRERKEGKMTKNVNTWALWTRTATHIKIRFQVPRQPEQKVGGTALSFHKKKGWMNQKLESRLPGEISITLDMQIINLCFADYTKAFDCVDHNKVWKILKRDGNIRPPYLPPEKSVCRSRSNS